MTAGTATVAGTSAKTGLAAAIGTTDPVNAIDSTVSQGDTTATSAASVTLAMLAAITSATAIAPAIGMASASDRRRSRRRRLTVRSHLRASHGRIGRRIRNSAHSIAIAPTVGIAANAVGVAVAAVVGDGGTSGRDPKTRVATQGPRAVNTTSLRRHRRVMGDRSASCRARLQKRRCGNPRPWRQQIHRRIRAHRHPSKSTSRSGLPVRRAQPKVRAATITDAQTQGVLR